MTDKETDKKQIIAKYQECLRIGHYIEAGRYKRLYLSPQESRHAAIDLYKSLARKNTDADDSNAARVRSHLIFTSEEMDKIFSEIGKTV
jgi:hypothetical protein